MTTLVLGLAVSGRAAATLLATQGESVIGYDSRLDAATDLPLTDVVLGEWDRRILNDVDLVVTSPGIPETAAPIRDALDSGVAVWSEIELAFRAHRSTPVVAITGTNGKTTVTEMVASMLSESGSDAAAVGNIGEPFSSVGNHEVIVVEASSFQLRFIDQFAPSAAVVTNFAPDHLDWHSDLAAYAAAKARIFEKMSPGAPLVFDEDDPGAVDLVSAAATVRSPVSGIRLQADAEADGFIRLGGAEVSVEGLGRSDAVMLVDLGMAAVAAAAVGATPEGIARAALGYRPGAHRREVVAEIDGVTFVNDSKATNPHAALAAIDSFPSVVLIAGGRAKGLDIRPLATAASVHGLVAIGESGPVLVEARPDAVTAATMREAVEHAVSMSRPGDVVLLAPGCASFDMFTSYGHRGDAFADAVRQRVGV
jgi:UDP-N-acetylmuramoylalanine--D-glutamate ligase